MKTTGLSRYDELDSRAPPAFRQLRIDPDGHPWEITHNPGWRTTSEGAVRYEEE